MAQPGDPRHITCGFKIPTESYCDQPYIVQTDDGAWLCVVTTGAGKEGEAGQHVVTMRSTDQGRTWSPPVAVEPADGPEASYAVPLKLPNGRIYVFYNHNTDNLREALADDPPYPGGKCTRVDSLGYFVCKYSDDHGRTWSAQRYTLPVREMEIDRQNPYGGTVRFFWNVGKPFLHEGAAYVPLHKVGGFGHGFFTRSEGVLLKCANILTERDPANLTWETLPDGDAGLRTPPGGGPIAEEHSFSVLSDGSFFVVYRSIDGHPVCSYSRDGGHTWSTPEYLRYANGRLVKHPRAANFAWRCSNGKFLYWFHNHGGNWYEDRNPVWLAGGVEADSPEGKIIHWSQPEILLYDDDPYIRMSYPDLIEQDGRFFFSETQKAVARVHPVDNSLLEGLWGQFDQPTRATAGLLLELSAQDAPLPARVDMPDLPAFLQRDNTRADYGTQDLRQGFTLELWVRFHSLEPGQVLLDNRMDNGQGFCLQTAPRGTLEIVLHDGRTENRWTSDPGRLAEGPLHHVAVVVDAGPKIITFIVDGVLCDGGDWRQFGWGRFSRDLRGVSGADQLRIAPTLNGEIRLLRLYGRYLRTSEVVANWNYGV